MLAKILTISLKTARYRELRKGVQTLLLLFLVVNGRPAVAQSVADIDPASTLTVADASPLTEKASFELPVAGPEKPPTVQEVMLDVCERRGYGEECAKTLLGIMWKESRNVGTAIGDGGKARGYFQIHYRLHKISIACAEDLLCSAEWTLDYLERNGYPKYPRYAVQCHNGCNVPNGYAASALRHGDRLWPQEMPVAQLALAE